MQPAIDKLEIYNFWNSFATEKKYILKIKPNIYKDLFILVILQNHLLDDDIVRNLIV